MFPAGSWPARRSSSALVPPLCPPVPGEQHAPVLQVWGCARPACWQLRTWCRRSEPGAPLVALERVLWARRWDPISLFPGGPTARLRVVGYPAGPRAPGQCCGHHNQVAGSPVSPQEGMGRMCAGHPDLCLHPGHPQRRRGRLEAPPDRHPHRAFDSHFDQRLGKGKDFFSAGEPATQPGDNRCDPQLRCPGCKTEAWEQPHRSPR